MKRPAGKGYGADCQLSIFFIDCFLSVHWQFEGMMKRPAENGRDGRGHKC
jgi:hypothetical protein